MTGARGMAGGLLRLVNPGAAYGVGMPAMDQMLVWIPRKEATASLDDVRPLALPTTLARVISGLLCRILLPAPAAALRPAQALVGDLVESLPVCGQARACLRKRGRGAVAS